MKRISFSLIGGLVIPFAYFLLLFLFFILLKATNINIGGDSWVAWLITLPLEWSGYIYNWLFPPESEIVYGRLRAEVIWAQIITNFIVSFVVTYIFLSWRARHKGLR